MGQTRHVDKWLGGHMDGLMDLMDGLMYMDRSRNGDVLGNVDGLDDVVNMDGGSSRSNYCCCCWRCCCSWCGCRTSCLCGTGWRWKVISFCRRRLVRNEHFHYICARFSLLLLLFLCLWPAGEDQ